MVGEVIRPPNKKPLSPLRMTDTNQLGKLNKGLQAPERHMRYLASLRLAWDWKPTCLIHRKRLFSQVQELWKSGSTIERRTMKRVHIVGGKNHGKTTLVVELLKELQDRGLRVGTIKHTHHDHELDIPGKDSHRHRQAGAAFVGILSRSMNAVFWLNQDPPDAHSEPRYDSFVNAYGSCDLVLVEGDTQTDALKVEVWRAALGTSPVCHRIKNIRAVVTDDSLTADCPILARKKCRGNRRFHPGTARG